MGESVNPNVARLLGVTVVPQLSNAHEIAKLIERYNTPELRLTGVCGTVIVSADIDANGRVSQAKAIRAMSTSDMGIHGVFVDPSDESSVMQSMAPDPDPRVRAAAEAVVRELRFQPAELDGTAVPFWDLRIGLNFPF